MNTEAGLHLACAGHARAREGDALEELVHDGAALPGGSGAALVGDRRDVGRRGHLEHPLEVKR